MIEGRDLYALALLKIASEKKEQGTMLPATIGAGAAGLAGGAAGTVAGHIIGLDMAERKGRAFIDQVKGKVKDFQGMSLGKKLRLLFRKKAEAEKTAMTRAGVALSTAALVLLLAETGVAAVDIAKMVRDHMKSKTEKKK